MKKQIFKKGDTVYWGQLKGEVEEYKDSSDYPVRIYFENDIKEWFTFDGELIEGYPPVLSFTPYTLEGFTQERPYEFKDGDAVWVRDNDNHRWGIAIFRGYENGSYLASQNKEDAPVCWEQCKPFKKEE